MPANSYPRFINYELNNPQVWILKDDDGRDYGYIQPMTCRLTLCFIVHLIVVVNYEPPPWVKMVTLIDVGVWKFMGMIWFTCADILFNSQCSREVVRPMSPVNGLILLSLIYNWKVINLGWFWLYPTTNMDRLLSQIQR